MQTRLLTRLASAAALIACFALPMAAQAAPPHPLGVSKPVVDHNIAVSKRHQKRVHASEHASSPALHKAPGRGYLKALPHATDR